VQTDGGIAVLGFPELDDPGLVALFVDPFTFPAGPFLTRLNEALEEIPLVGGIAAGGGRPGTQALIAVPRLPLLPLPELNGKEGVDGSSPSEGFAKAPQIGTFAFRSTCSRANVR
jgi:hypothetical protein